MTTWVVLRWENCETLKLFYLSDLSPHWSFCILICTQYVVFFYGFS